MSLEVPRSTGMTVKNMRHPGMHNTQCPDRYPHNRACQISTASLCLLRPLRPNAQVSGNIFLGGSTELQVLGTNASMVQHVSWGKVLCVVP